jgi:hypothetical protein
MFCALHQFILPDAHRLRKLESSSRKKAAVYIMPKAQAMCWDSS